MCSASFAHALEPFPGKVFGVKWDLKTQIGDVPTNGLVNQNYISNYQQIDIGIDNMALENKIRFWSRN
jgi:hypothetical protein